MWNFLAPPAHKQELPAEKIDSAYKSYLLASLPGYIYRLRRFLYRA